MGTSRYLWEESTQPMIAPQQESSTFSQQHQHAHEKYVARRLLLHPSPDFGFPAEDLFGRSSKEHHTIDTHSKSVVARVSSGGTAAHRLCARCNFNLYRDSSLLQTKRFSDRRLFLDRVG